MESLEFLEPLEHRVRLVLLDNQDKLACPEYLEYQYDSTAHNAHLILYTHIHTPTHAQAHECINADTQTYTHTHKPILYMALWLDLNFGSIQI